MIILKQIDSILHLALFEPRSLGPFSSSLKKDQERRDLEDDVGVCSETDYRWSQNL